MSHAPPTRRAGVHCRTAAPLLSFRPCDGLGCSGSGRWSGQCSRWRCPLERRLPTPASSRKAARHARTWSRRHAPPATRSTRKPAPFARWWARPRRPRRVHAAPMLRAKCRSQWWPRESSAIHGPLHSLPRRARLPRCDQTARCVCPAPDEACHRVHRSGVANAARRCHHHTSQHPCAPSDWPLPQFYSASARSAHSSRIRQHALERAPIPSPGRYGTRSRS